MTRSFAMVVIVLPMVMLLGPFIIVDYIKYARYRITYKRKQNESLIDPNENPILVLDYNNKIQIVKYRIAFIACVAVALFGFFTADKAARYDMHRLFFFLNKEQTYILYFWTWKVVTFALLLIFGPVSLQYFNRRVLFYKKAVVVENSIQGRSIFELNEKVRLRSQPINTWLYDAGKGITILVFSKKLMKINAYQEKMIADILSKIPEKKKFLGSY